MKLEIREDSKNYTATVIKLPPKQKVNGLDNLVKVTVFGNDCLVSKDEDEEQLYLFFPSGTQLSNQFCWYNNLFRDIVLNRDNTKKGFFEVNGRVKAIKFKGIISSGFVIPISSLGENDSISKLKEGDEFTDINDYNVCQKYISRNVNIPGAKGDKVSKINKKLVDLLIPNQFRFHEETSHLGRNLHQFNEEDIIVITDKWHGSSCILSKVLINKKLKWWEKLFNRFGAQIPTKEYGYIYSSGKPRSNLPKGIEGAWENKGIDYYSVNIWKRAFDDHKHVLEDGISIYSELVGFAWDGGYIQGGYDYKCDYGTYKMMVYRITYTKPDGNVIEYSWQQIKDYCKKYGLEHVKELYFGRIPFSKTIPDMISYYPILATSFNMEKDCSHCVNKVPAEGMVVRIDGREKFMAYKLKAKKFLKLEDDELDKVINLEQDA